MPEGDTVRCRDKHRAKAASSGAALLALLFGLAAGCDDTPPETPGSSLDAGPPAVTPSTRNQLIWKRYRAFEQTLSRGLLLDASGMCDELGRLSCIDEVHLTALGGNDPFLQGLHEPLAAPSATTPVAVERVALAACQAAVRVDSERPTGLVFLDLDLADNARALDLDDEEQRFAVEDTSRTLYRRLHAREPLAEELEELKALVRDDDGAPLLPRDFALLACFAVATTTEALFF